MPSTSYTQLAVMNVNWSRSIQEEALSIVQNTQKYCFVK